MRHSRKKLLRDALTCLQEIEEFTIGVHFEQFLDNRKLQKENLKSLENPSTDFESWMNKLWKRYRT